VRRLTSNRTGVTTIRSVGATTFRSLPVDSEFTYGDEVGVPMKKRH
jgi:hypothetical protein